MFVDPPGSEQVTQDKIDMNFDIKKSLEKHKNIHIVFNQVLYKKNGRNIKEMESFVSLPNAATTFSASRCWFGLCYKLRGGSGKSRRGENVPFVNYLCVITRRKFRLLRGLENYL